MDETAETSNEESTSLISVNGIVVMSIAIFIDVAGGLVSLIPAVGWIINIGITIFAIVFFTAWGRYHKENIIERRAAARASMAKGAKTVRTFSRISKLVKLLKWIRPIVEFIPGLNLLPLWTITTYLELKYS